VRHEVDFLPPGSRRRASRPRGSGNRSSIWLLAVIGLAILATDTVLRYRLQGLRAARAQATREADALALMTDQIDQLNRRHDEAIRQLVEWSAPLEARRATEVLDVILTARPEALYLKKVEWDSGRVEAPMEPAPTLRIAGDLENLGDVVSFVRALEEPGVLPELQVRQSGLAKAASDRDREVQSFVIESLSGEGRR